ncbi:TonB-dependent receptor plug domain-containing protein [Niabella terrae]
MIQKKNTTGFFASLLSFLLIAGPAAGQHVQDSSQMLQEVTVVTGQYRPQSLKKSVFNIRVITAAEIQAKAAVNLSQLLNTQLGIRFSNDNTLGVADIELMGMSGRGVKILLDGIPLTDRNDTRESLNQIDLDRIQQIEIVEGPMSVVYGADALAGVINIITRKTTGSHLRAGLRLQEETAGNEYSAFGNKGVHLQSVNASFGRQAFFVNGGLSRVDHRGYGGDLYGRAKAWKPKEQYMGHLMLGWRTPTHTTYYRLDGLDETILSRGPINWDNYKAYDQRYITRRWMHQLQDDRHLGKRWHLNSAAAFTDYNRHTRTTRHDFTTGEDQLSTGAGEQDTARFNTLLFRTQAFYQPNENWSFQPGIEVNHNSASGARITGRPEINDFAFFASAEWKPFSSIVLRPGMRLIKNALYDAPPVIPAFNAKVGLTDRLDLRLAYARGYRAPALRELYFDFIDANHAILGNRDLKAENSRSLDAALNWQYRSGAWKVVSNLSGFYNVFEDLIDYATDPAEPTITRLFNVSRFKTTGIRWEQQLLYQNWQVQAGLLYVGRYNKLHEDKDLDSDVPVFNWSPEINASIYYKLDKISTSFALMYKFTGACNGYQLSGTEGAPVVLTKVDAYHWADLTATKNLWHRLMLQAGVKNIFDINNINSTAMSGGAHSSSGPLPISYGRSYFLNISYHFFKK